MANLAKTQTSASRARTTKVAREPSEPVTPDAIAARAYEIWQETGCPAGHDLDNWLQAERELGARA
jgi:hypothetical protein